MYRKVEGPWRCEKCGEISQMADEQKYVNRIYCTNPACDFSRLIDKQRQVIVEDDGTQWKYDGDGNKRRVTAR